ncbi:GNAT family N-acetyltransferase [Microbulbifer agarilyticus]
MMQVQFRPCLPSDVEDAVPLIHSSGPAAYDYVFCDSAPGQALAFLQSAFVGERSEFSYRQHWAGLVDGELVACGGLRYAHQNFRFASAAGGRILRSYPVAGAIRTMLRGLKTERTIAPPSGKAGILYNLGVSPCWQGQGIGQQLVAFLLQQLREQGIETAGLDVAATNTGARRLYERLGFQPVVTRSGNLESRYGRVVDHTYMTLALGDN